MEDQVEKKVFCQKHEIRFSDKRIYLILHFPIFMMFILRGVHHRQNILFMLY